MADSSPEGADRATHLKVVVVRQRRAPGTRGAAKNSMIERSLRDAEARVGGAIDCLKAQIEEIRDGGGNPGKNSPGGVEDPPEPADLTDHEFLAYLHHFGFDIHAKWEHFQTWMFWSLCVVVGIVLRVQSNGFFHLPHAVRTEHPYLDALFVMVVWGFINKMVSRLAYATLPSWVTTGKVLVERYSLINPIADVADWSKDHRADVKSTGKLLHKNPRLFTVRCETRKLLSSGLASRWHSTERLVSYEMLCQLAVSKNCDLTLHEDVVFAKIHASANRLGSVNDPRYLSGVNYTVAQNTAVLAFALHRRMLEEMEHLNFPRPKPMTP